MSGPSTSSDQSSKVTKLRSNSELSKRDKILKYLALNNLKESASSQSNTNYGSTDPVQSNSSSSSYYASIASTIFSFTLRGSQSSTTTGQQHQPAPKRLSVSTISTSFLYDDIDLIRIVLAPPSSTNFFSYLNNSNGSHSAANAIKVNLNNSVNKKISLKKGIFFSI